jgi:hypothetical protein
LRRSAAGSIGGGMTSSHIFTWAIRAPCSAAPPISSSWTPGRGVGSTVGREERREQLLADDSHSLRGHEDDARRLVWSTSLTDWSRTYHRASDSGTDQQPGYLRRYSSRAPPSTPAALSCANALRAHPTRRAKLPASVRDSTMPRSLCPPAPPDYSTLVAWAFRRHELAILATRAVSTYAGQSPLMGRGPAASAPLFAATDPMRSSALLARRALPPC